MNAAEDSVQLNKKKKGTLVFLLRGRVFSLRYALRQAIVSLPDYSRVLQVMFSLRYALRQAIVSLPNYCRLLQVMF
jgi:hypothetical protein